MKKHSTGVQLSLLIFLALAVMTIYGVRRSYVVRNQRAACHRVNLEKLSSLEPSTTTIDNEVKEIQQDQDMIDQLGDSDDETVTQRRDRMIDGVKLKLTNVSRDRAENQRRTEQLQAELSTCLAGVE